MLPAGAVGPDQAASLAKPQRLLAAPATAPCHRARSWLPQPPPRRWHGSRTGRRRGEPPCSFIRSLEVPGWILPSWLSPNDPANPRTLVRQQRLRQLRRQLKDSARQPALLLPVPAGEESASCGVAGSNGSNGSNGGSGGSGEAGTAVDVTHSASNAVPFTAGAQGNAASSLTVALNGGAASVCRADEVRTVLPWLFAAEGRLDFTAMEHMASSWALSGLQLLDVTRFAAAAGAANGHWHSSWGSHVRWAGPQALPSPAVAAAAALRRMELRRGGALGSLPEMDGKAVVVTFHPQHRQLAAETLALYLHTYLGLSGQEAVEAAGRATGSAPLESTLRQSMQELATIADGWYRRVTLAWPYAGGHVEVVGDAVCGWDQRAPMVFNVKKKRWQLQIWGLQPGIHRFKYLVDGCWVIDLAGHTEADSRGNINNVVLVTSRPTALLSTLSGDSGDRKSVV